MITRDAPARFNTCSPCTYPYTIPCTFPGSDMTEKDVSWSATHLDASDVDAPDMCTWTRQKGQDSSSALAW